MLTPVKIAKYLSQQLNVQIPLPQQIPDKVSIKNGSIKISMKFLI
jgi:hypothetical protein